MTVICSFDSFYKQMYYSTPWCGLLNETFYGLRFFSSISFFLFLFLFPSYFCFNFEIFIIIYNYEWL